MIDERIQRARWLLGHIKHAAMATVNDDGTPHNTPYLFMKSDDLRELYWGSNPKSLHSQNVERTGRIFVVLYEAHEGGGLYIQCNNARIAEGETFDRALTAHNNVRASFKKEPLPESYYVSPLEQRMYVAEPTAFWVNHAERDDKGLIREDKRFAISRDDLMG